MSPLPPSQQRPRPNSSPNAADVLVVPTRVVPRLADLTPSEVSALFTSVQAVGKILERAYGADGLTVACQVRARLLLLLLLTAPHSPFDS